MKLLLSLLLLALPLTSQAADSFFGVGIVLKQVEDKFFIEELIVGGPAEKSGLVHAGDELVAVQAIAGRDFPWVSVERMPIEDVVGMIRGEEGTNVGLHLTNANGQVEAIMTRAKIDIE
jgi:carboxyl-terminal processing protease